MPPKSRAPKGGYDFEAKADYRERVWKVFAEQLDPATAHVAFLPGPEGLEIPIALKYGFKAENLHAIDDNPALIATAQWRKAYPTVQVYGSEAARAVERIAKKGIILGALHLDFCSNFSNTIAATMRKIGSSKAIDEKTLFAVLLLKGRENVESSGVLSLIDGCPKGINRRIHASLVPVYKKVVYDVIAAGDYKFTSPMTWGIVKRSPYQPIPYDKSASGYLGVYSRGTRWQARGYLKHNLGSYTSPELAGAEVAKWKAGLPSGTSIRPRTYGLGSVCVAPRSGRRWRVSFSWRSEGSTLSLVGPHRRTIAQAEEDASKIKACLTLEARLLATKALRASDLGPRKVGDGVSQTPYGKWRVYRKYFGTPLHLGVFNTRSAASHVGVEWDRQVRHGNVLHEEFMARLRAA